MDQTYEWYDRLHLFGVLLLGVKGRDMRNGQWCNTTYLKGVNVDDPQLAISSLVIVKLHERSYNWSL